MSTFVYGHHKTASESYMQSAILKSSNHSRADAIQKLEFLPRFRQNSFESRAGFQILSKICVRRLFHTCV